jgi:Gpi18-like mannosyltransferase
VRLGAEVEEVLREGVVTSVPRREAWLLALCAALVSIAFAESHGTVDVLLFKDWVHHAESQGLVAGYAANDADYPPLASTILVGAARVATLAGVRLQTAIKWSTILFLFATSALFLAWTKDAFAAALLHLSLVLSAAAMAYLDVYYAPLLVAAFWALERRRLLLFSCCFTLAATTKWQPLLLAPFLVVHLLATTRDPASRRVDVRALALRVVLPAAAIVAAVVALFGVGPVWSAFKAGTSHDVLSGYALNLAWVETHLLRLFDPAKWGAIEQGKAELVLASSLAVRLPLQLLFGGSYLALLVAFARREKSLENLLTFALLGALAYFTLAVGVHENHFFPAALLAVLLAWRQRERTAAALTIVALSHVDLLLFWGLDGMGPRFPRALGQRFDVALPLALFEVLFFVVFAVSRVRATRRATPGR